MENSLASKIRVVDKMPPTTGWLNEVHKVLTQMSFNVQDIHFFINYLVLHDGYIN